MNSITSPRQVPLITYPVNHMQSWAKKLLLGMLIHLQRGQLVIKENGQTLTFGQDPSLQAKIQINHPSFYLKVLTGGSIGAGEAYVDGLWDSEDLTAVIRIIVANQHTLQQLDRKMAWLTAPFYRLQHLINNNSKRGSKKNILAHYDLGNEMYRTFLDPTMMYSSAIYPERTSTLEEASIHKLDLVCRRLQLKAEDRVIEIGSGWGGFAIHAATHYGCHVTTTTISDAQYEEAKRRIEQLNLGDRITLLKKDYRDLEGQFDKLVSIEMIEAVGYRHLPGYVAKCSSLLKDDGMMLLQAITIKDQLYRSYLKGVDFIQRHIFPGGCLLSNQHLMTLICEQSDMVVREIHDFGLDYARTLNDWKKRFNRAFNSIKQNGYDEQFRRLWEFYFCYCEGGFRERSISVIHLCAAKPQHRL